MSVSRDPRDRHDPATDDAARDDTARDDAATAAADAAPADGVETAPVAEDPTAAEPEPELPDEPTTPATGTGTTTDEESDGPGDDDAPGDPGPADGDPEDGRDAAAEEPTPTPGALGEDAAGDRADGDPADGEPATVVSSRDRRDDTVETAPHESDDEDAHVPDGAPARAPGGTPDDLDGASTDDAPAPEGDSAPAPEGDATPTEPPAVTGAIGAVGRHGTPTRPEPRGLRGLGRALRPRASRSQIVVGILCALLGFAVVVQVSQTQEDQLSSLRQSDLVRLLDEVTQRSGELEDQVSSLEGTRDELQSGSGRERAALELAEQQAETLGILSGRLPAEGPGVQIEVVEGSQALDAFALFNVLEELRNAGAEAMEVNGVRLVASSYFEDSADGIVVDGQTIASPYRWNVIGDPSTLETALEIPGGAMASLRADGARTTITQQDRVEVSATVEPGAPQYATPVPADE